MQARFLALLGKHEPVRRLPHRRADHIAEAGLALALAAQIDGNRALILGAVLRDGGQGAVDLRAQLRIGEAQRPHILKDRLHKTVGGDESQAMPDRLAAIVGELRLLFLDAEHPAGRVHAAFDLDLGADKRVQERRLRLERLLAEGQIPEYLDERRLAGKAHRADGAGAIEHRQALENVVHLVEPHRQLDDRARRDAARMGELR